MIIQLIMGVLDAIVGGIFSIMPDVAVPGWFTGSLDAIGGLFGAATTMGVWIPVPLALAVASILFMAMMGGAIIKLARVIASFVSGGGGSAA